MKKAQVVGQVFILILAALVFILILLYGYRAISSFGERSEQVALIDFETDLASEVETMSLKFGSVKRLDLTLPTRYREVCLFCDPELTKKGLASCDPALSSAQTFKQDNTLLFESWEGGAQNVFFRPLADTQILIENLEVQGVGNCTSVIDGRVSLRLEGKGDRTLVSSWE
jgi:hypothetical protein